LIGCKKPIENAELTDPIYMDLLAEQDRAKKEVEAKEKELTTLRDGYSQLKDNDYQKKVTREEIFKTENDLYKLKQKLY
jgi:predicted  nucleic acid-binding Zn-ribbon protein